MQFHEYTIDSRNKKEVKSIYFVKKSKIDRDVRYLVWQYYRDRKRTKVEDVIKRSKREKKIVFEMHIIYFGDPVIYKEPLSEYSPLYLKAEIETKVEAKVETKVDLEKIDINK